MSALHNARQLVAPIPRATRYGETEGSEFWEEHSSLLRHAWNEWESQADLPQLNASSLLDVKLRKAIETAWNDPSTENNILSHWTKVAPKVFCGQLLDPQGLQDIRRYIDGASYEALIPARRPNSMNRYGLITHPPDAPGAVNLEGLENFYEELLRIYIQPLGRLFFPQLVGPGDDEESYAFTIRYREGEDLELDEHSDSSLITLNVNLNLPHEDYQGSTLYFVDDATGEHHNVTFAPGMALLHPGLMRHGALPLQSGQRTNWIIWLHGANGYVRIMPYPENEQLTRNQRWTINTPDATFEQSQFQDFQEF